MQAEQKDLETLLEIQKIDLEVMRLKKERAELPERIEVVKVRKKRDEVAPKLDQIIALQDAKQAEITAVEDEDRGLADKQEKAQADIDASGSDYRAVDSHAREMAGIVKRRATLEEKLNELNAELDKVKQVRAQIEGAIAACDSREEVLRASYKEHDDELVENARKLLAEKDGLASSVSVELVELYESTAKKIGGVAIGKLVEGKCGVCRSTIDGGRLIELRANAPLGQCPNCKRMLIIEA